MKEAPCRSVFPALIILSALFLGGCEGMRQKKAVNTVIENIGPLPNFDFQLPSDYTNWKPELIRWKASAIAFHKKLSDISVVSCPEDFRQRFYELVEAARNIRQIAEQDIPESEEQLIAMALRNATSNKEMDGGIRRVRNNMLDGNDRLKKCSTELEVVASKYR